MFFYRLFWWMGGLFIIEEVFHMGVFVVIPLLVFFYWAPFIHMELVEEWKSDREKKRKKAEDEREKVKYEKIQRMFQIADVDSMSGTEFEKFVERLMMNEGYKCSLTGGAGDFGADIMAKKDGKNIAVQVKRHNKNISRRAVSDAVAARQYFGCNEAMVVTNNYFTKGTTEFARKTGCTLVDRDSIASWIKRFSSASTTQI